MKRTKLTLSHLSMILGCSSFIMSSCIKDDITGNTDEEKIPVLTTTAVTSIYCLAMCGGTISYDNGLALRANGVCWSTNQAPTIRDNKTTGGVVVANSFTSKITNLTANTTYYVRAYATNSAGTGYGNTMSFTTIKDIVFNADIPYGSMTDIEGNTYKTVTIGTQTWMAENLKVTKYNDNTEIPKVTQGIAWELITCGAYCTYDNEPGNVSTFGQLYNWTAVNTGKLAPTGWHVPSSEEWTILTNYLIANGYNYDGSTSDNLIGKSLASTTGWRETENIGTASYDLASNNKSGFTGIPSGCRLSRQSTTNPLGFSGIGDGAFWWTSTSDNRYVPQGQIGPDAYRCELYLVNAGAGVGPCTKEWGLSVRCVKNN